MFSKNILRPVNLTSVTLKRLFSDEKLITSNFTNGVKTIKLCHPPTRNSLSIAMMEKLINAINEDQANIDLRVLVLAAEGPVFSAGHNLKELDSKNGRANQEKVFKLSSKLMSSIIDSPVPVIAKVNGVAAAAGCQLVAQCDLAICTEKSTFSTPGASFGIFCSTPGVALARSINKTSALRMLLTGLPISSVEAKRIGLVTDVCAEEALDKETDKLCDAIRNKSRSVIELGKRFYYKQIHTDLKSAYKIGEDVMIENLQMKDGQEGIKSFIEKRKASWSHENEK